MASLIMTLAVALLTAVNAPSSPTPQDAGSKVDSLIRAFDSQKGEASRRTAAEFFELLEREEFSGEKIELPPKGPQEYDRLKALTWCWAGEWYFDCQDYDRSIDYSLRAIKLCGTFSDPLLEADCSSLLSILYFRKSDYPLAIEYAKRTLEIAREQKDISRMSTTLNTLAGICLASRQPGQGEQYILEAIRLCEQDRDTVKLSVRYGMAAEIYHAMGNDRKNLEYSRKAYAIDTLMGRTDKAAIRLAQMAEAYFSLEENAKAQECLDKAMPVFKQVGNLQSWAISANLYGDILLEYGEPQAAEPYYREALDIFSRRRDRYNESHSRMGLGKSLLVSDPVEAARQMEIYSRLRDSLYDSQMLMGLNEMNARFGNDKLKSERDGYRRSLIILTIASMLIIIALAYTAVRRRRSKDQYVARMVQAVSAAPELAVKERTEDEEFMATLGSLIREAMDSGKVDFEGIASRLFISRTHLNRKVKAITGGTTSDLVLSYRIAKAKDLLLSTELPVWEIAEKCGINDPAYFSTLFKKAVGKSPLQFRNDTT